MTVLHEPSLAPPERANKERRGITLWVTAREAFWIALEALRSHKLRSFLTLLGVVIATTTLIVVMSVVNGMNLYIAEHIANLGTNTFVLHQFQWAQGFDAFLKARRRNQPIRIEDYEYLRDNLQGYQQIGAMAQPAARIRRRATRATSIDEITLNGMTASFADIGREKVADRAATSTRATTSTTRASASSARTWWRSCFPTSIRSTRKCRSAGFPSASSASRKKSAALSGRARTTSPSFR